MELKKHSPSRVFQLGPLKHLILSPRPLPPSSANMSESISSPHFDVCLDAKPILGMSS